MVWLRILILLIVPFVIRGYTWRKGQGKIRLRYGCQLPPVPRHGYFRYDDRMRSIGYKCFEGFQLTTTHDPYWRRCQDGKWSGSKVYCIGNKSDRQCPNLRPPKDGKVQVTGESSGAIAKFKCKKGYILLGEESMMCGSGLHWTGQIPECKPYKNVEDYTRLLQEKFIDTFKGASADSSGLQGKLSPGKRGLDIVFALDTSASVGLHNLELAKEFIKSIVKQFGVSKFPNGTTADGDNNGTRVSLITFNEEAVFNFKLDDADVRSVADVEEALRKVNKTSGGTDFRAPLNLMIGRGRFGKASSNKTRALFFITDSENTKTSAADAILLQNSATFLKTSKGFEVFAIGIGKNVDNAALAELATPPFAEHVFVVEKFEDLKKMSDIIAEKNIDYGQCGISGDTSSASTEAKKGAWPWVAWLSVASDKVSLTCGGTLICDRWLITAAQCVTWLGVNESAVHVVDTHHVNVHLGNDNWYDKSDDDNSIVVPVTRIFVHPKYTGHLTEEGVRKFDVALLYLGNRTQSTRPVLNKYIRPICFPAKDGTLVEGKVYRQSETALMAQRASPEHEDGFVVGWGHAGHEMLFDTPGKSLAQKERPIRPERECNAEFPNLDHSMFICVGGKPLASTKCFEDIGGAYYAEIKPAQTRVTMLGLNVNRDECFEYSLFLNIFHPEINTWISDKLGNCSRVGERPALTEEEEVEYEDRIFERGVFAVSDEEDNAEDNEEGNEEDTGEDGQEANKDNDEEGFATVPNLDNGHVVDFNNKRMKLPANEQIKPDMSVMVKCDPTHEAFRDGVFLRSTVELRSKNNNGTWEPSIAECRPKVNAADGADDPDAPQAEGADDPDESQGDGADDLDGPLAGEEYNPDY